MIWGKIKEIIEFKLTGKQLLAINNNRPKAAEVNNFLDLKSLTRDKTDPQLSKLITDFLRILWSTAKNFICKSQ